MTGWLPRAACVAGLVCGSLVLARAQAPHAVIYRGDQGPGVGRHIVLLAGDHEYRSEEALPALARILARRFGFTCTVLFTTDPASGAILPGSSHIGGLDILRTADLLIVFLRFQDFPDDEMQHIVEYLHQGKPVVGLRTATHAFQIARPDARFAQYSWKGVPGFEGGFGRQILGETWVSHYGTNHKQSSRLIIPADQAAHPILRGVADMWVQSGGYTADPMPGSTVLARGQVLEGMTPEAPPARDKVQLPVAWTREYRVGPGSAGRVFATTHGASEDLLNVGFRRLLVNAALWAVGMEAAIRPDANIEFVGPYHPSPYAFDGFVPGVKPADLAGWDTPIPK